MAKAFSHGLNCTTQQNEQIYFWDDSTHTEWIMACNCSVLKKKHIIQSTVNELKVIAKLLLNLDYPSPHMVSTTVMILSCISCMICWSAGWNSNDDNNTNSNNNLQFIQFFCGVSIFISSGICILMWVHSHGGVLIFSHILSFGIWVFHMCGFFCCIRLSLQMIFQPLFSLYS